MKFKNHLKSCSAMARHALVLPVTLLLLFGFTAPQARAESSKANPMPLTTNHVEGDDEPRGQSQFYSFTAGPGEITVNVDGITDFYSSNMKITLMDDAGRELAVIPVTATGLGAKGSAKLKLTRKQPVIMQINLGLAVGVHVKYNVTLNGPMFPPGEEAIANTSSPATSHTTNPVTTTVVSQPNTIAMSGTMAGAKPAFVPRVTVDTSPDLVMTKANDSSDDDGTPKLINAPIEDKWALVVGISKFQKPGVDLKYSSKDAKDLYNYLIEEGNFAPDHVKLLTDEQATKERVLAELGDHWLPRVARPNDLVLIFISSHGSPSNMDVAGLNYLVMHNTDPESLYATGLPLQELATAIRQRVHSNRVVMIIDACHSGAANTSKNIVRVGNVDSNTLLQGTGQLVICSSLPNQVSWESKRYENGVFTHQLIAALRGLKGKGTLAQVFDQMKESIESEVLTDRSELQTPVLKSKWQGNDLVISAPPSKPRLLPTGLQSIKR